MTNHIRNATLIAAVLFAFAASAQAQRLRLVPTPTPSILPKLGMHADFIPHHGYRVNSVVMNGRAWRMGIERGDLIVGLNGHALNYNGSWQHVLADAMRHGGHVTLCIQDCRTGQIVHRSTSLHNHVQPSVYYGGLPVSVGVPKYYIPVIRP